MVVFPTHLKNMLVKSDHFPKDRGEYQQCGNHHLVGGAVLSTINVGDGGVSLMAEWGSYLCFC